MGPLADASKATTEDQQQVLTALITLYKSISQPHTKPRLKQEIAGLARSLSLDSGTTRELLKAVDALAEDSSSACACDCHPETGTKAISTDQGSQGDQTRGILFPEVKMLRLREVLEIVPCSASSWWAWVKAGKAPASVKLGERTTCWRYADIIAFVEGRWEASHD